MLYHITKKTASSDPVVLEPVSLSDLSRAGWKEKDLENVLADRIDYLIRGDQLMVIFQERQFQEDAGPRNPRLPRRANSGNCLGAFVLRCTAGQTDNRFRSVSLTVMGEFVTGGLAEWMIDPGIKASERLDDVLFRQSRGDRFWHSYVPEIAQRTGMKKSSFSTALDRQS